MQPILTTNSTFNPLLTTTVSNVQNTLFDKIKQATLSLIYDLSTELKSNSHNSSHLWIIPLQNFITLHCSPLYNTPEALGEILQNLSLHEFSSEMLEEAAKVNNTVFTPSQTHTNRQKDLEAALKSCRQQMNFKSEYFLRKIFVNLVRMDSSPSREELSLCIGFEQDHLETVESLGNSVEDIQEKYDDHLESYLDLLSKFTSIEFAPEDISIKDKFLKSLNFLQLHYEKNALTEADRDLSRNALVFLFSRPEWLFYRNLVKITAHLTIAKKNADEVKKQKIELDIILVQANQAIENKFMNSVQLDLYKGLLNRIVKILPTLSPSDKIIALSTGGQLYQVIAERHANPTEIKDKMLSCLKSIITIGETHMEKLEYKALQILSKTYFSYGFYLTLCFKTTEDFNEGLLALSKVSKSFWADSKTQQAAERLSKCLSSLKELPPSVKFDKETFMLIQRFKLMLQGDLYHLNLNYKNQVESTKIDTFSASAPKEVNIEELLEIEELVWDICQKDFSSFFFNSQLKEAQNIINLYFCHHYKRSNEVLKLHYNNSYTRFLRIDQNKAEVGSEVEITIDDDKITNFLIDAKKSPLTSVLFVDLESKLLNSYKVGKLQIPGEGGKDQLIPFFSSIELFGRIYDTVLHFLNTCQGKLSNVDFMAHTLRAYLREIFGSELLLKINNPDIRRNSGAEGKAMDILRHDYNSISHYCDMSSDLYKWMECYLPSNEYGNIFQHTLNSIWIGLMMSKSNQAKLQWHYAYRDIAFRNYEYEIGSNNPQKEKKALILFIHATACQLTLTENPEERTALENNICSSMPDTFEKILKEVEENQIDDEYLNYYIQTALIKSMVLISNQKVQEGMSLFNDLMEYYFKDIKYQKKMKQLAKEGNIGTKYQLKFRVEARCSNNLFNPNRIQTPEIEQLKNTPIESKKQEIVSESDNSSSSNHPSEKKLILEQAQQILKNQELKKEKKQLRVASKNTTNSTAQKELEKEEGVSTSEPVAIKYINKKSMLIFNLLWQSNSLSESSWETKSYRNDIKIKRREVLKLIQSLGGTYSPNRGHGSHHVAHLPKIELNGKDVGGLVDYENNELMITLTNDEELKYYQIIQLRKILLGQGFNPDTVKEKSQDKE